MFWLLIKIKRISYKYEKIYTCHNFDILFIFFCLGEHRFIICPTFAPLF